jgi:hypothetical protein
MPVQIQALLHSAISLVIQANLWSRNLTNGVIKLANTDFGLASWCIDYLPSFHLCSVTRCFFA